MAQRGEMDGDLAGKRDVEQGDPGEEAQQEGQRRVSEATATSEGDNEERTAAENREAQEALHKAAAQAAAAAADQEARAEDEQLEQAKAEREVAEAQLNEDDATTRTASKTLSQESAVLEPATAQVEGLPGTAIAYKLCGCLPIPQWWSNTYIVDWAGVVLCAIVLLIANGPIDWLKHFPIDMSEVHIQQPLHSDRVHMITVGVLVVVPCVVVAIFFWFKRRDMFEDLHAFALATVAPVVFAYVVWVIIGNAAGKLRPDFLARCAPTCMENFTWTCAPDPSLYAADACDLSEQKCCPVQCGRQDPRYPDILECSFLQNGIDLSTSTLQSVCNKFWDSTYVGVTRLNDMKHDMFDIVLGAFIGFITSFIAYPLYFQNPTLGGEPLRRPNHFTIKDVLCCRKQDPWPAANTHLAASDYPSSAFAQPQQAVEGQESATLLADVPSSSSTQYKHANMSIV
ncbi:Phospholipid phosphatase 4 [Hondaea fermentalgiana]|uniref:Phospholipid phosphatase 4 n=1 Tax=Hondaea fermentalgiana TaxID=2315210 RepID=A0A2R5G3N0_9STRA|nr:Phospholipid phosphatase 4 [Hondaea fermentalgiana]|eukprot:GBG25135.1 Phospholipid phosphatase 4 [Hondaea fermentalgiana]